jgi:lipoate-protein ligase B
VQANNKKPDNYLMLVEHNPVYTTGIRTREYDNLEEDRLVKLGADFIRSNRGGLITFHGPGQLVAYPILDLTQFLNFKDDQVGKKKSRVLGMKWYVNQLEEVVIQTLDKNFGLKGFRSPYTGVWVDDKHSGQFDDMTFLAF